MVTTQLGEVPLHDAPLQPAKVKPLTGVAVSVTAAPSSKYAAQLVEQSIPAGAELTTPEPLTDTSSSRVVLPIAVKVA